MISQTEAGQGTLHINLEGALEVGSHPDFKEKLRAVVKPTHEKILLDLSQASFIDSTCLGSILALARDIEKRGGRLALCGARGEVQSILEITRLGKVLKIFSSRAEAVHYLTR